MSTKVRAAASTLADYAGKAGDGRMQALARIALARGETVSSLARRLGGGRDASNVRRHFELRKRDGRGVVGLYVDKLGRNDVERGLIREYLDVIDGKFDASLAREALYRELRAHELDLRDGALAHFLSALDALDDATLLPALAAYRRMGLETQLGLITPTMNALALSYVGRKLGFALAAFADVIREHVNVEAYMAPDRTPAEDTLWLVWAHMQMPDSLFTDEDREVTIDLLAGRLLRRGVDPEPMLRYVARLRRHNVRTEAALRAAAPVTEPTPPNRKDGSVKRPRKRT
jgi:hypothetical protein